MDTNEALDNAIMQVAKAKVAEALGVDVVERIVKTVMDHKSRPYGNSDNKTEFEKIVEEVVRQAIVTAVREYMAENVETVKAAVKTAMNTRHSVIAAKIVDQIASDDWTTDINVTFER